MCTFNNRSAPGRDKWCGGGKAARAVHHVQNPTLLGFFGFLTSGQPEGPPPCWNSPLTFGLISADSKRQHSRKQRSYDRGGGHPVLSVCRGDGPGARTYQDQTHYGSYKYFVQRHTFFNLMNTVWIQNTTGRLCLIILYSQHCYICRLLDSTVSEDAGIKPGLLRLCHWQLNHLTTRLIFVHARLNFIRTQLNFNSTRLNLFYTLQNLIRTLQNFIRTQLNLIRARLTLIITRQNLIRLRQNLTCARLNLILTGQNLISYWINLIRARLNLIHLR